MKTNKTLTTFDRIMLAITFAEANETDTARNILSPRKQERLNAGIDKRPNTRPTLRA